MSALVCLAGWSGASVGNGSALGRPDGVAARPLVDGIWEDRAMRCGNWLIAVVVACLVGGLSMTDGVLAQDAAGDIRQFKLTSEQIKGLVAAQPDLAGLAERLEKLPDDTEVSVQKELNGIATKHGFKDFTELDDVSANVQIVLDGIDPETGDYADPLIDLKEELAEVRADKKLPADEKKALIEELEEAVNSIPPLKFPENVELVKSHHKLIQNALDAGDAGN